MKRKGVACFVLITVLLCSFALPCFADGLPPPLDSPWYGHKINVYFPDVYYNSGSGLANGITEVEYYLEETFEPENYEDRYDNKYFIRIYTVNEIDSQGRFTTSTTVLWNFGENDYENQRGVIYQGDNPWEAVTAITFSPNRTPIQMEEVRHDMNTDGSVYQEYRLEFTIGPWQGGRNAVRNIYLWCEAVSMHKQDEIVTDQEIIDNLLEEVGGTQIDPNDINADAFRQVTDMLFGMWMVQYICVAVIGIAAIGYILYGKR